MRLLRRVSGSVFNRFIAFFLLTITPICLIAITLYNWQIRQLDHATVAAFETDTRHQFANVEDELAKVRTLSVASLLDEDLIMLSNASQVMTDYQKIVSINRYIRRIETLKNSSAYIQSIATYIPSIHRVIDDRGTLNANADEVMQIYEAYKQQPDWAFSVQDGRLYYVFLPPGTNISTDTFNYLLVIQLSKSRMLEEFATVAGAERYVLYDDYYAYAEYEKETSSNDSAPLKDLLHSMPPDASYPLKGEGGQGWIVRHSSADMGLSLAAYLPVREINPQMRELRGYFILFSIAIVLTVFGLTYLSARLFKKPLGKLVSAFGEVERGGLDVQLNHPNNDEFRYIFRSFNEMIAKMKNLMQREYQHKILAQRAQLKQLQSQINPHFLYNSFFVIQNMARLRDHESIKRFSEYLALYYQFITQKQSGDIRFAKEVEHSRIYADIQKMRFGERLSIHFGEIPAAAMDVMVPRLILQPLVENAFEHGIHHADEGVLQVHFHMENDLLTVYVEDNGTMTDEEIAHIAHHVTHASEEVSGMANIHQRLQLRYGKDSGIAVSRSRLGGLKITLTIREARHV